MQFLAVGNEYSTISDANHEPTTLVAGALRGVLGQEKQVLGALQQPQPEVWTHVLRQLASVQNEWPKIVGDKG